MPLPCCFAKNLLGSAAKRDDAAGVPETQHPDQHARLLAQCAQAQVELGRGGCGSTAAGAASLMTRLKWSWIWGADAVAAAPRQEERQSNK